MGEKITVVCPNCRARLSFQSFPGYQEKIIECPHCHFKAQATGYVVGANARVTSVEDAATRLYSPNVPVNKDLGQLRIIQSGQICPLKLGSQVIGRIAKTGTADIKVTNDMYMSRQHAKIEVVDKGDEIEHRLYEINAVNIIKLNGKPICRGDILILKFGDVMTLGQTDIRLEACNDESTRIM